MAYENVRFNYENFCIGAQAGTFCSINTINPSAAILRVKNSSGTVIRDYTLNPTISNKVESLEYTGPRGLSNFYNGLEFFTLEKNSSTQCTIKKWKLNHTNTTLDLDQTIVKTTSDPYYYNCSDMAIEYYHTEFDGATTTGTGKIKLDSYSNVEVGDELFLGPSSDVDNLGDTEYVEVTSVSGGWVYITTSGIVPPVYEYVDEDSITYYKNIFLFSDIGQSNDSTKGSLYKLAKDGSISDIQDSGLYAGIRSSAWSLTYQNIGLIKGSNLIYVDPNDNYENKKSHALTNIEDDDSTIITVYDLIFDSNSIYRLQKKITLRDDDGNKSTTTWSTYNYHQDTIVPYTFSTTLLVSPDNIAMNHEQNLKITAVVRDQFGVGLLNKLIYFTKDGDANGSFDPINGQVYTNSSGIATIEYDTGYYNPESIDFDTQKVVIDAKTNGGSTYLGVTGYTGQIHGFTSIFLCNRFSIDLSNITQIGDIEEETRVQQIGDIEIDLEVVSLKEFESTIGITQRFEQEGEVGIIQIGSADFVGTIEVNQLKEVTNDLNVSQTYTSRHLLSGHKDDVNIDQFKFIEDAIPAFWSEKNPIGTNIWIRLRPFGFNLNQNSVVFRVREVSYIGDTGYCDVSSLCTITTFDAGGGLLGLDILYNPSQNFHYNAIIYVSIEIYDTAPVPNIILTDYWFKAVPDYKAPYITNENPSREEEDILVDTNISFDIFDVGAGVDINTLEFYIDNAYKIPTISSITDGYHINYNPSTDFYYGKTIEITVNIKDKSNFKNQLYDMWRFYCIGSKGPWFDHDSFIPRRCSMGIDRKKTNISFNVYDLGDGIDKNSMIVTIGGKQRNVTMTPIIYRQD